MQSPDFIRGARAYWAGHTDDISESAQWHAGYEWARAEDNRRGFPR